MAVRDGDADQQANDRLRHRHGLEAIAVATVILISLDQDPVITGDQKTRDGVVCEIVIETEPSAVQFEPDRRLLRRAAERHCLLRRLNLVRRNQAVPAAVAADKVLLQLGLWSGGGGVTL